MDKLYLKEREFVRYVAEALVFYEPSQIFVGFSSGTDSLVASHLTMRYFPESIICHINPGIGSYKSREYLKEYCKELGWPVEEVRAKEDAGYDYEEIVMKEGFPGPAQHLTMYTQLKERALRVLHRKYKRYRGDKILMITGIRYDESNPRTGYANKVINVVGGIVWVNAMYWFTKQDKYDYIKKHNLRVNPVHKVTGMSHECGCGSYASKGELDLIRIADPRFADDLERLQKKVCKKFPWGWEEQPPKWWKSMKKGQEDLFIEREQYQPLCMGCGKRN